MALFQWQKGRQPRRLLCFSAAFFLSTLTVTLLFGSFDPISALLLASAALCGVGAGVVWLLREAPAWFLPMLSGLLAGLIWCWGYAALAYRPAEALAGRTGTLRVELTEAAQGRTSYGLAYGVLREIDGEPCRHRVRIFLKDGSPNYEPGDALTFTGTVRLSNPAPSANLLQRGAFLTLRQEGWEETVRGGAMTPLRWCRKLSQKLAGRIAQLLPGEEGALLAALLIGDRSLLPHSLDRALTVSGIRHITAVSGLHVSILAGMFLWLFGKRRGLLIVLPFSLLYAALVGFPASVVRAVVMLFFWSGAFLWKEEKDSLTALGTALLLLLLWNPFSSVSAGLLLSFSATLGLILLAGPLSKLLHRPFRKMRDSLLKKLLHYLAASVAASTAAIAFTFPLELLFFDTVPLVGVVTNLLVLWAVALTMELGLAALLLSLIWLPGAQGFAAYVVRWPLWWMAHAARWIGSLRFASGDSANLFLAFFGIVLLLALLLWKGKLLSGKMLLFTVAVVFCLSAGASAIQSMLIGQVRVFSSGGQAGLILKGREISLINTGSSGEDALRELETALAKWNASGVDTILCTSDSYKTQAGLPRVLDDARPRRVILPARESGFPSAVYSEKLRSFSHGGALRINDLSAELLPAGEGCYALRLVGRHFSLLDLGGVKAAQAQTVLEELEDKGVQYLLLDDGLMGDASFMNQVVADFRPERLLVASGGYRTYDASDYRGIPVIAVDYEGISLRYMR